MNASITSRSYRKQASIAGFTLIELMVTITVMAIIVSIAAPSINNQLANQRIKSTTATLTNALKEARVESVIRRQEIEVLVDNKGYKIEIGIKIDDDDEDDDNNDNDDNNENNKIAVYSYNAKSIIKGDDDLSFKPNKTADNETYTICDTNEAATPRKITVTELGNISSQLELGGSC